MIARGWRIDESFVSRRSRNRFFRLFSYRSFTDVDLYQGIMLPMVRAIRWRRAAELVSEAISDCLEASNSRGPLDDYALLSHLLLSSAAKTDLD